MTYWSSLWIALLVLTSGCAFTAEDTTTGAMPNQPPRSVNARALGYGVFLPSCVLFCVATGQASQAEHGDAQAGDLTTTTSIDANLAKRPVTKIKPKMKPQMIGKGVKQ